MRKRLLGTAVLASAIALGTAQAASAGNGGWFYNSAISINALRPYGQQFHVAFDVDQTNSNWVNATNRSYAWTTHCVGCNTAAIAFQVVVAPLGGSFNGDNEAHAVEDHCVNCSNLASSYQFVLTEPNPQISWQTRQQLDGIKGQLYALQWSGLTGSSLQSAIDSLAGQVESDLLSGAAQPAPSPLAASPLVAAPAAATPSVATPAAASPVSAAPLAATPITAAPPQLTVNRQVQSQ